MKFGFYRENITPQEPIRMAGYGSRTAPNIGVHDELYVKSLMLTDGTAKVLVVVLDLCHVGRDFVFRIKERLGGRHGLSASEILIHTIHTHAGPVSGLHDRGKDSGAESRYMVMLEDKILHCAACAMDSLQEGTLQIGTGETYIGSNRRQKTENGVRIGPNPDGPVDRLLAVAGIRDREDRLRVVLMSCACHPVVLYPDNMRISADFPGAACRELEERMPETAVMFLQSACGDINPAVLVGGDNYRSTFYTDVVLTGRVLANDVTNVLRCGMRPVKFDLETRLDTIELPLGEYKTDYFENLLTQGNDWQKAYARRMLDSIGNHTEPKTADVQAAVIRLSEDVRIIGLEGEICNEIGVHIRQTIGGGNTLVLGYSNGSLTYIPTRRILREGGYEAISAYAQCGLPGPFADNAEDVILDYCRALTE